MHHCRSVRAANFIHRLAAALCLVVTMASASGAQDLLVSSEGTNSVKRYDGLTGVYKGDFVATGSGGLNKPEGLAYGLDGNLYVSSSGSNKVLRYNGQTGAYLGVALQTSLATPWDLYCGSDGVMYVSSSATNRVVAFNPVTSAIARTIGATGSMSKPDGLTIGPDGMLYVCSTNNARVLKYNPSTGAFLGNFATTGITRANDIVFGTDGLAYVLDNTGQILRYAQSGQFIDQWRFGAGSPGLVQGPDGRFYTSNYGEGTIQRFGDSGEGVFVTSGDGGLNRPTNMIFMIPEPGTAALAVVLIVLRRRRPAR